MGIPELVRIVQTDPAVAAQLEHLVDLQRWMTIGIAVIALAFLMIGAFALYLLAKARRMIVDVQRTFQRVAPELGPTLGRVKTSVEAAGDTIDEVRTRVQDISATFDEANRSLREAGRGAEVRVRELAAVLDVVREEAQELLLDGAATAHGIHTTAKALRNPRPVGRELKPEPPPPIPEEVRRTSHGQG